MEKECRRALLEAQFLPAPQNVQGLAELVAGIFSHLGVGAVHFQCAVGRDDVLGLDYAKLVLIFLFKRLVHML